MSRIFFTTHDPCKSDGGVLSRRGRKDSRSGAGTFTRSQLCQVMSLPSLWKNVEKSICQQKLRTARCCLHFLHVNLNDCKAELTTVPFITETKPNPPGET